MWLYTHDATGTQHQDDTLGRWRPSADGAPHLNRKSRLVIPARFLPRYFATRSMMSSISTLRELPIALGIGPRPVSLVALSSLTAATQNRPTISR